MFCSQSAGCKPGQGDKFCWKHHQCHQPTLPESLWFPARHAAAPDLDVRSEIESTMNGGSLWQCNVAVHFNPICFQVKWHVAMVQLVGLGQVTLNLIRGPSCRAQSALLARHGSWRIQMRESARLMWRSHLTKVSHQIWMSCR